MQTGINVLMQVTKRAYHDGALSCGCARRARFVDRGLLVPFAPMATKKVRKAVRAVLGGEAGERPMVELPFDVAATFGSARPKVKVTVNGVELRTTVAVYGGRSYVGFRQEIRAAAGIAIGDEIRVTIEPDTEPREVDLPADLRKALATDRLAGKAFDALAFTHKREYAAWIAGAKKQDTRDRRVAKTLAMLKAGTKSP